MAKTFNRLAQVANAAPSPVTQLGRIPRRKKDEVVNLERYNLGDRGNWLRAIEDTCPDKTASLDELLNQISLYQGQIEQTMQSAEAQSTIYAYAIGSRLDVIEEDRLFERRGYKNLTDFIKGGEIRRPGGTSITTRQVWAYRKVTRGLHEFLSLAEALRDGGEVPEPIQANLERISAHVNVDVIQRFRDSYVEGIAKVLELGVSKLEQVCRLPESAAYSGLLAGGQLPIAQEIIPAHEISFSELRTAVSHETAKKEKPKTALKGALSANRTIKQIEALVAVLTEHRGALKTAQKRRITALADALDELTSSDLDAHKT